MMELEPKALTFRDVFLNQAYTSSVCITNPLTAPVEFTLRPSSPRYTVTPNRVNLSGGQSIVVTVRLFLSHYPNFRQGLRGQDDTIHIKSAYFEQKLDVAFFLHSRDSTTLASRSRSSSPMRPGMAAAVAGDSLAELQRQVHAKDAKIAQLETIIGQLESKYPSVQEIVRNRIEQERVIFEEKSEKVVALFATSAVGALLSHTTPPPLPTPPVPSHSLRLSHYCSEKTRRLATCRGNWPRALRPSRFFVFRKRPSRLPQEMSRQKTARRFQI